LSAIVTALNDICVLAVGTSGTETKNLAWDEVVAVRVDLVNVDYAELIGGGIVGG